MIELLELFLVFSAYKLVKFSVENGQVFETVVTLFSLTISEYKHQTWFGCRFSSLSLSLSMNEFGCRICCYYYLLNFDRRLLREREREGERERVFHFILYIFFPSCSLVFLTWWHRYCQKKWIPICLPANMYIMCAIN